jgi:hypothetical protein
MLRRSFRFALFVLCFSSSAFAATITVTSTDDSIIPGDAKLTLREAITAINAGNGLGDPDIAAQSPGTFGTGDTINFSIAGAGVHTITLVSNLPNINKAVFINGYSQPGASANTNAFNAGINAVLQIEISLIPGGTGLNILAPGTTVRGLAMHGYRGISVSASNVVIAGNFIGTDAAGTTALPSNPSLGVYAIQASSFGSTIVSNLTIGGPAAADRNLIVSGNVGVQLPFVSPGPGTGYIIQGNYIGTDITGTLALARGNGLDAIANALVSGNLISGNPGGGIQLMDNNTVQGNLIGTQRDGASPLPNGNFGGIEIHGGNSTIGGAGAGESNIIANHAGYGIDIYNGITQGSSNINTRNRITRNSIYANERLGIGLRYSSSPLPNDNKDVDTWLTDHVGNDGQNYPVISSAVVSGGSVTISGTINSLVGSAFALEFFANAACDVSTGYGQGQSFIGATAVNTNASGDASFGPLTFVVPAGQVVITSTATDAAGNTSEFSQCLTASSGGLNPTTMTLASSLNPSMFDQSVTFTANVFVLPNLKAAAPIEAGSTLATPPAVTGNVSFSDGATTLASVPLSGNSAALTLSSLSVGSHPIKVTYSGDATFGSSLASLDQMVTSVVQIASAQPIPTLSGWACIGISMLLLLVGLGSSTCLPRR